MNKLLLGRYVNGDSLVHRMDARSKLVLSFYFVAIIFLCNNWQTYLLLAAFVLMCVKFSDLGIGFFIKGVKPLLGLIVFTVLLQVFFTRGGHVYSASTVVGDEWPASAGQVSLAQRRAVETQGRCGSRAAASSPRNDC